MLIEKRSFDGGCDSDTDARQLPPNVMLNCMNGRMAVSKHGRMLRIENTPGTTRITDNIRPPYGTSQTIGTAVDWDDMRILALNYNTVGDHWISCYDPAANSGAGRLYAVLYDSQVLGGLNFSRNSLIHSARVENGYLYWADSTNNEPRRLNINAGIEMNHGGTFPDVDPYSYPMTQSVIRWIRRQPGLPLGVSKELDGTFVNNFIKNEAFLVQWRFIYRGYETSTLSAFSGLMNYNIATDTDNYIAIVAPLGEAIDQDVIQVDYIAKYLNGGKSFVIHSWNKSIAADLIQINAHNAGTTPLTFNFYNDFTGIALDDAYSVKPFDSLPIYAQTIEMARFRSFMANYTAGYDTPVITSLTASLSSQTQSASLTGTWITVVYNGGASTLYFISIELAGGLTFFSSPLTPPFPGSITYASITQVAVGWGNFTAYLNTTYGLITSVSFQGSTSDVTGGPAPAGIIGLTAYKFGASYQLSINFFDHAGRKCGILTNEDLKIPIPERVYAQTTFYTFINWFLSNTNAVNEIPEFAYYYSIDITKCLTTRYFLDARVKNLTYATKDADGVYVFNNAAYSVDRNGIGIDITRLNGWGAGYTFSEGDLVKIYIGSNVYNLSITGQDGNWIICELANIGAIGTTAVPFTTALFEIYTPYKPSLSEPYWEVYNLYPVTNPTAANRTYSTLSGSIGGDITILQRNDGTQDYLTENMSPNDKFFNIWNTASGRPNFIDTIGQVVRTDSIAYSNTYISGTKVNGLSTYDALDVKDIGIGALTKLQVANKQGKDEGDIMLAIAETETASLYLGEVQLVGQASNAFVAQAPSVIGTINVLKGSLGTTKAESVTAYLGLVFGIDLNKGMYWQYSPAGLEPVSRYKMSRFFKNYCDGYLATNNSNLDNINGFHHIRSSVNPFHKSVQVILPSLIYENYADVLPSYSSVPSYATSIIDRFDIFDELGKTMSFSFEENKWGNNYQWMPEWSDYLQNNMYLFKDGYMWLANSNTTNWNTVFDVTYPVRICGTANINSSLLKDLANIAVESNAAPDFSVAMANYPFTQITDLAADDYEDEQGTFYATWLMDRLSPNAIGTADERLYTGDQLTDIAIFWQLEFQQYESLFYCNFVNIGWEASRGQTAISNPINK